MHGPSYIKFSEAANLADWVPALDNQIADLQFVETFSCCYSAEVVGHGQHLNVHIQPAHRASYDVGKD